MRCQFAVPRRLGRTVLAAALFAAALFAAALFAAAPGARAEDGPPSFHDGFGLTQVGAPVVRSSTDVTITVATPQLSNMHRIRVFLPRGYASDPTRRWPVAYFLHGGPGNVDDAEAAPALHADGMITVVPDGGLKGWYTNWRMQNTAEGAANWETFHLDQVVPFIDANLRTLADRSHRAVLGLSMGGFGALHYAQDRPDLFGHTASFSGAVDFGLPAIRGAVLATELNLPGALCAVSSQCVSYGPVVDSDAVFGSPYPVFNADRIWNEVNPAAPANLSRLSHTGIALYTGSTLPLDSVTAAATATVKTRLDGLGIPSHFNNYGNGSSLAAGCDGGHNYGCWAPAIADYVPRLQAAFAIGS